VISLTKREQHRPGAGAASVWARGRIVGLTAAHGRHVGTGAGIPRWRCSGRRFGIRMRGQWNFAWSQDQRGWVFSVGCRLSDHRPVMAAASRAGSLNSDSPFMRWLPNSLSAMRVWEAPLWHGFSPRIALVYAHGSRRYVRRPVTWMMGPSRIWCIGPAAECLSEPILQTIASHVRALGPRALPCLGGGHS